MKSLQVEPSGTNAQFAPTHWSLVLSAAQRDAPGATEALEQLCGTYWYPLYAFLRRSGHASHAAQDLVQGFFGQLLAKESRLQSADPAKGRFRSFLLACLKHYVANENAKTVLRGVIPRKRCCPSTKRRLRNGMILNRRR